MKKINRREFLKDGAGAMGLAIGGGLFGRGISRSRRFQGPGIVIGEPTAARAGNDMLKEGGNVVDGIVAAALAAAVTAIGSCGIGGYGGHMILALTQGRKIRSIDFNTAAPAAARDDMFPLDEHGVVRDDVNSYGWLAAGVPGTLAGLGLALERYGTRSFRQVVGPAIELAREGFPLSEGMARYIRNAATLLRSDPGTERLLFADGDAPQPGAKFRNPDLARLLETLAARNSVDSFYRGDIGRRIAEAFRSHGGLVTAEDMADYRARVVKPLELKWRGLTVCTAPLTAGGLTVLETLSILKALNWETRPGSPERTQLKIEALRLAWKDRLQLLGDPEKTEVPVKKLLSRDYAGEMAAKIERAVKKRKPLSLEFDSRPQDGTVHLSAVDGHGNMAAITLTHGNTLGARVTVDGLGLVLGHGMSRFDPRPGHPNSPGPGKRPLNNMCPTIVLRDGHGVLALGGTGGRKIPNSVFEVLARYGGRNASMKEAMAAPRLQTEGDLKLVLEAGWPAEEAKFLETLGYAVQSGPSAVVSAVSFDPETGECSAATR